MPGPEEHLPLSRRIALILLSWLAMIGFDLILHAGLLSGIYRQPSPFLLPPERAFILIPVGYLSFLLLAILLVWLIGGLNVQGWRRGAVFGLVIGSLIWGSMVLGLLSVSTAPPTLMLGWFLGQSIELGVGGAVAGSGLEGQRLRRLFVVVLLFLVCAFAIAILLQNLTGGTLN
jgi:hypothetical protein